MKQKLHITSDQRPYKALEIGSNFISFRVFIQIWHYWQWQQNNRNSNSNHSNR